MTRILRFFPAILVLIASGIAIAFGEHSILIRTLGVGGVIISVLLVRKTQKGTTIGTKRNDNPRLYSKGRNNILSIIAILVALVVLSGITIWLSLDNRLKVAQFDIHYIYIGVGFAAAIFLGLINYFTRKKK